MSNNRLLGDAQLHSFFKRIVDETRITSLDLSDNKISGNEALVFFETSNRIIQLNLSNNRLGTDFARKITLRPHQGRLVFENLNFSRNFLPPIEAEMLLKYFQDCPTLQLLNLSRQSSRTREYTVLRDEWQSNRFQLDPVGIETEQETFENEYENEEDDQSDDTIEE